MDNQSTLVELHRILSHHEKAEALSQQISKQEDEIRTISRKISIVKSQKSECTTNPKSKVHIKSLPTDNYKHQEGIIRKTRLDLCKYRAQRILKWLFVLSILAVGLAVWCSINNGFSCSEPLDYIQIIFYSMMPVLASFCIMRFFFCKISEDTKVPIWLYILGYFSISGTFYAIFMALGVYIIFWAFSVAIMVLVGYNRIKKYNSVAHNNFTYTDYDRSCLDKAQKLDNANAKKNVQNYHAEQERINEASASRLAQLDAEENQLSTRNKSAQLTLQKLQSELDAHVKEAGSQLLSSKDNNLDSVRELIEYLETGRADSLKEALQLKDIRSQQRAHTDAVLLNQRLMHDQDKWLNDMQRMKVEDDLRLAREQNALYRENMKEKASAAVHELEKLNEYLSDNN